MNKIRQALFSLKDEKYGDFTAKLVPKVKRELIIGVRTPSLRKLAGELTAAESAEFFADLPHKYFEENNLHGALICRIRDFDECIKALDGFLPFVDNWSTCDMMNPPVLKKNKGRLLEKIKEWLASDRIYTVRFGIKMLMTHFLDSDFKPEYLDFVAAVNSDEYYVNMMIAWFFATALAKQYESAAVFIKEKRLPVWVHNKTITKARESYRITPQQKETLKNYYIKTKG